MTECGALRIPITIIAFDGHPFMVVEEGLSEGAGDNTGPAPDTEVFIDDDPVVFFRFPVAGFGRADFHAVSLFAMIAGHGEIKANVFPFDDLDAGTAWITGAVVIDGTDHLTLTAPRTFFLIYHQYLLLHSTLHD